MSFEAIMVFMPRRIRFCVGGSKTVLPKNRPPNFRVLYHPLVGSKVGDREVIAFTGWPRKVTVDMKGLKEMDQYCTKSNVFRKTHIDQGD